MAFRVLGILILIATFQHYANCIKISSPSTLVNVPFRNSEFLNTRCGPCVQCSNTTSCIFCDWKTYVWDGSFCTISAPSVSENDVSSDDETANYLQPALQQAGMTQINSPKIVTGTVEPSEWQDYTIMDTGIYVTVNISSFNFTNPPKIFTSISSVNGTHHWNLIGFSSIYNLTNVGFTVYAQCFDRDYIVRASDAVNNQWRLDYLAISQDFS